MDRLAYLKKLMPYLIKVRRYLHKHPEIGFKETNTNRYINKILTKTNIDVIVPRVAKTGIIANMNINKDYKTLAFRADIDGLPVADKKNVSYKSIYNGMSHSCGHDVHTTILIGVIIMLQRLRDSLKCNLIFIFQPAEEGPGGAERIIDSSLIDNANMILGLHVLPHLPTGYIAVSEGLVMGASSKIQIRIRSKSSHVAELNKDENPIEISAELILFLKNLEKKFNEKHENFLFSISTINGGYYYNTLSDDISMTGTIRSFSQDINKMFFNYIKQEMKKSFPDKIVNAIEMSFESMYPPLYNSNESVNLIKKAGAKSLGPDKVVPAWKVLGADDFAFYTKKIDGGYFWLGTNFNGEPQHNLHSPYFDVDENCIYYGILTLVESALCYS
ncbi:M20 metallopeptidase family protein [Bacillus velezensis]|uniref:M20 metallopeptidase family protein n=1 Tax=Bacillus velezensis TaxID=492670 RepID=UPI0022E6F575|nr:M20 family metallopeptidase [Bacillus velezensis]